MTDTSDETVSKYEPNSRDGYDILCRYNPKGLFRKVESWPTVEMARKAVEQYSEDYQMRGAILRDTKGWNFEEKKFHGPREPRKPRAPRGPKEPDVHFSFED